MANSSGPTGESTSRRRRRAARPRRPLGRCRGERRSRATAAQHALERARCRGQSSLYSVRSRFRPSWTLRRAASSLVPITAEISAYAASSDVPQRDRRALLVGELSHALHSSWSGRRPRAAAVRSGVSATGTARRRRAGSGRSPCGGDRQDPAPRFDARAAAGTPQRRDPRLLVAVVGVLADEWRRKRCTSRPWASSSSWNGGRFTACLKRAAGHGVSSRGKNIAAGALTRPRIRVYKRVWPAQSGPARSASGWSTCP